MSPHSVLSVITCSHGPRVFLGPFFTELVPITPLEQPGRRVHPTFQMLMKVFWKVNGGQRPGDQVTWCRCGLSNHIAEGGNAKKIRALQCL